MWQQALTELMPYQAKGLRLRKTDARDVDLHLQICNDPNVRRFVGPPLNLSREDALNVVVKRPFGMGGIFVVEDAERDVSIGECGFIASNYIAGVDMSIMLLPQHHSRGYGRRILNTLYCLWVNELGEDTCFATIWKANAAARAILHSEGFVKIGQYVDVRVDEPCLVYERQRASIAT